MSSREELSSRQSDYSTGSEDENDDIDWKRRSRRPDTHRNTDTSRSAASGRSVGHSSAGRKPSESGLTRHQPVASRAGNSVHSRVSSTRGAGNREPQQETSSFRRDTSCAASCRDERRVSGDRHDSRDRKGLLQTRLGLTEDVPFEKFVERAGRFLEEPVVKFPLLKACLETIGRSNFLRLLVDTEDTEARGGLPTRNRLRKRTKGGVFYVLLNRAPYIPCADKEAFAVVSKEDQKAEAKAKKKLKRQQERKPTLWTPPAATASPAGS